MDDCIIDIRGLWTRFGGNVVHRDIDLCVHRGEVLSLVGGLGSGKTTILRQILGLERPSHGQPSDFDPSLPQGRPHEPRTRPGHALDHAA